MQADWAGQGQSGASFSGLCSVAQAEGPSWAEGRSQTTGIAAGLRLLIRSGFCPQSGMIQLSLYIA